MISLGSCEMWGDMSLWWIGEAEDEVFAFPSKTYEYKTKQGTDPFPSTFSDPLENH